ncbi:hypothetical protein Tco_1057687 [Tanacetum coccineum]|uniref:Xylulose kinase-1 n=1 Tax=Tanacetum coccineum TaxID=301880 RepID=A0ABQ5H655_9ASTR
MLAIDGVGFDWSDMAEEQVQTNMALMAFSDSEFIAATYKRGLATVEEQLIAYRKNEFEKVKQEKDGIEFKIEKFDKALKDLDQLLGCQITDKSKKGLRYSAVPPPHPLIYNRPKKLDLSYSGLDEFKEPEFKGYGPENKEQVSQVTSSFVKSSLNVDKETIFPVDKKGNPQQDDKGFVNSCEYDIWAMKMEHYLGHTDYPIWEVIQKRNSPVQVSAYTNGQIRVLPPKTAEEILARERERKARTTLLMSIPEDHLAKFHKMNDAKEMWEAIKSRFGGNDESKKM